MLGKFYMAPVKAWLSTRGEGIQAAAVIAGLIGIAVTSFSMDPGAHGRIRA